MPWSKVQNHKSCPSSKHWAVVKDDGGKVVGCHASEKQANKQLAALNASEERAMGLLDRTIERVKAVLGEDSGNDGKMLTRTFIRREQDGTHRWFSVSAVSAENRVGEIDSRDLFDSFLQIAEATGKYPERDFMHLGRWDKVFRIGQTDFMARDGNTFVTSGLYYDTELARMEIAARQSNPEEWGDSIEFQSLDDMEWMGGTPVFKMGFLRFIATVPEKMAASHFTSGIVQEVDRMAMSKQQLEAFSTLFGDEKKAREWLESHVEDVEAAIEEAGMLTRSVEEEVEEEVEAKVEVETGVQDLEIDIAEDVLTELVERASELALTKVSAQLEQAESAISQLNENLSALNGTVQKENKEVERRLEVLERDADQVVEDVMRDMPRRVMVSSSATYRPRQAEAVETQETPGQQAERVISEKWDVDHYNEQ